MSFSEVALHIRRATRYRADALTWHLAPPVWRRRWNPTFDRAIDPHVQPPTSSLLIGRERVGTVRVALANAEAEIVAEAKRRLEGRVTVLGYPELALGRQRAFDRDPLSGRAWPDRHGRLLDIREGPGDPKLIWELERCQELPLLALASHLTGDARFADEAASRLRCWLACHPPGRGVAWANTYEPAIRALSLTVAFDSLRGHALLSGEAERDVVCGIWQHGRWIVNDLSRYSSANNHLVGELVGLLAIAVLVPELRDSSRWLDIALDELSRESSLQILGDGCSVEQSFAYGLFTVDLFLTCAALLDAARVPCPEPIRAALSRAADALVLLVDVDEPEPAFGDDDDGRALVLDGARDRSGPGVASSLAALLGHAGARRLAQSIDPTAALLFGREGLTRFESVGRAPSPGDAILPDAGLVVFRRAGARVLFDVGPLGYLSIAAHGHADALQVVVSLGVDELVTDPGTGSYAGDPELHRRLRGTAVHATVTVDGQDQSEQSGPFLWTRHAHSRLLKCDLRAGVAVGEHDGYQVLADPVTHQRAMIALERQAILVVDLLIGAAPHSYAQAWPLHPALVPQRLSGADVVVASSEGPTCVLALVSSPKSEIAVSHNGRWSRRLEQSEPAWVVSQRVSASGAVVLGALLVPVPRGAPVPRVGLELECDHQHGVATANVGDAVDEIRLGFDNGVLTLQRAP
jgi:hypothetical protein